MLACMEDVRLVEMWSQGVFINRRHGLAVVVVVLQSWISMINLPGADPKLVRKKSSGDPFAPWTARTCWTARMVWTARMEVVGPGRRSGRSLQPQIYSWITGMENETCSNMCLPFALEDYAWVNSCCRSGTAVFTGSVDVTRPFVSDVSLLVAHKN